METLEGLTDKRTDIVGEKSSSRKTISRKGELYWTRGTPRRKAIGRGITE